MGSAAGAGRAGMRPEVCRSPAHWGSGVEAGKGIANWYKHGHFLF